MLHGVGCDIVHVPRIARLLRIFGNRFLHRAFHASEIAHCRTLQSQLELRKSTRDADPAHLRARLHAAQPSGDTDDHSDDAAHVRFLAGRWALKEATLKAFGPRILFPEIVLEVSVDCQY